jgi:hypothetical protein
VWQPLHPAEVKTLLAVAVLAAALDEPEEPADGLDEAAPDEPDEEPPGM